MQGKFSPLFSRLTGSGRRAHFISAAGGLAFLAASAFFLVSCGGSNTSVPPPPVPVVQNINNSTDPSSPVSLPIEINGSGFQGSPGQVIFTQASSGITATVTPNSGGWSDSGIAVNVPTGEGANNFTVPGTVTVAVKTTGGTSNSVTLNLIQTLTFDVNNVTWSTTTALPSPLTGLRGVAVPIDNLNAFVVLTGGYDGSNNTSTVLCNTLNADGTVGPDWATIPTNILPENIAHHAMVEADSTRSLVATGEHYIYVLGGQIDSAAAPGGTTDVYMASVDSISGAVGAWTQLTSSLPEPLVGPAAALFNGYVYVIGGLRPDGTPSPNVYSAPVEPDGTLGTWTQSTNPYPMGVSFATAFGFAGRLYVLGGDTAGSTDPNEQGNPGVSNANYATVLNGVVGAWTGTASTIKKRKKQITWTAFGQVIDAEGVYEGLPGSQELERSQIQADSTLASFNGITAVNAPGANVYNAAAIVSPLKSPTSTPRFILIGGQVFSSLSTPGVITGSVYYNNAP
jgi:hypothetical protein